MGGPWCPLTPPQGPRELGSTCLWTLGGKWSHRKHTLAGGGHVDSHTHKHTLPVLFTYLKMNAGKRSFPGNYHLVVYFESWFVVSGIVDGIIIKKT